MEQAIRFRLPKGYWNQEKNRREFLDKLGKQLGFKSMNDWYRIKFKDVKYNGGIGLLHKYDDSPSKMLRSIYDEHVWNLQAFETIPHGYWNIKENHRDCMDWIGKQLGFQKMDDWYNVTLKDLQQNGGARLLSHYGDSPSKALLSVYPEHSWMSWRFHRVPVGTYGLNWMIGYN